MNLINRRCSLTSSGTPRLGPAEIANLLPQIPDWRLQGDRLTRVFTFADFKEAMAFLNRVAEVAEDQGHHPDFTVHYKEVEMSIWTHVISGLSENDFILAARIDALLPR